MYRWALALCTRSLIIQNPLQNVEKSTLPQLMYLCRPSMSYTNVLKLIGTRPPERSLSQLVGALGGSELVMQKTGVVTHSVNSRVSLEIFIFVSQHTTHH